MSEDVAERLKRLDDIIHNGLPWSELTHRDLEFLIEAALTQAERSREREAERIADALIDYVRGPYSRSFVIERIQDALKHTQEGRDG